MVCGRSLSNDNDALGFLRIGEHGMGQTNVWAGATELHAHWKFPMSEGSGVVWISSSVSIARAPAQGRDEEQGGPARGGA